MIEFPISSYFGVKKLESVQDKKIHKSLSWKYIGGKTLRIIQENSIGSFKKSSNICFSILIISFVILTIFISQIAASHRTWEYLVPGRWDAGHYLYIAEKGYRVVSCESVGHKQHAGFKHVPCGNYLWFPGWPLVQKGLVVLTGLNILVINNWTPILLVFLGLLISWQVADRLGFSPVGRLRIGLMFLLWPLGFYYLSSFPYGLIYFLSSLYFYFLYGKSPISGRLFILAPIGTALATTYPTAGLFAIFPCLHFLLSPTYGSLKKRILYCLASGLPFIAGTIGFIIYLGATFGDYNLYFLGQAGFGREPANPITFLFEIITSKYFWGFFSVNTSGLYAKEYSIMVILFYASLVVISSYYLPRKVKRPEFLVFSILLLGFSLATGSLMSIFRHLLLAYPILYGLESDQTERPLNTWRWLLGWVGPVAAAFFFFQSYEHFLREYIKGNLM